MTKRKDEGQTNNKKNKTKKRKRTNAQGARLYRKKNSEAMELLRYAVSDTQEFTKSALLQSAASLINTQREENNQLRQKNAELTKQLKESNKDNNVKRELITDQRKLIKKLNAILKFKSNEIKSLESELESPFRNPENWHNKFTECSNMLEKIQHAMNNIKSDKSGSPETVMSDSSSSQPEYMDRSKEEQFISAFFK